MTGEEMERAIEFLLQSQASVEARIEQVNRELGGRIAQTVESIAELNRVVQMQAESQGQLNEMLTRAVTGLAEAQTRTETKVDRLTGIVEKLAERLGA